MKILASLALVAALALAPAGAGAQPADDAAEPAPPSPEDLESARVDLEAGDAYFEAGHYQEAIEAYERGHAKSRKAGFLYNIAQAHRLAGECVAAIDRYEEYLRADPDTVRRAQIEQHIRSLEGCAEEERRAAAAAAAPVEPTPEPAPVEPAPAPQLAPAPPPSRGADDRQASGRWLGASVATAGLALLGTSGYFAYRGQSAESDLQDRLASCTPEAPCSPEVYDASLASRGERANTVAWITGIAGGMALAGGLTLMLLRDDGGDEASLALSPMVGGAALVYGGSF